MAIANSNLEAEMRRQGRRRERVYKRRRDRFFQKKKGRKRDRERDFSKIKKNKRDMMDWHDS